MAKGLQRIYSKIASVYDWVNRLLTFGLDGVWRRETAKIAEKGGGACWMDVCSGTGEMTAALKHVHPQKGALVSTDFSIPMLRRATTKRSIELVSFVLADTRDLPFRNHVFDLITIAFATRNLNLTPDLLNRCLSEIHQSLAVHGRFVNVETSQPSFVFTRILFHLYVKIVVKRLGRLLFGSATGAAFLANSIQRFYSANEFRDKLLQIGFTKVGCQPMMFGTVAIHQAIKES